MLKIKQAMNHSINFCGVHVPMGAVYAVVPEREILGTTMPKTYMWVEDIQKAATSRHFDMFIFTRNDKRPRRYRVDGLYGYAREFHDFVLCIPERHQHVHHGATIRDIHTLDVPRDRCVGRYTMRGVPSYDTAPRVMTENLVTNGCKIGNRILSHEGYCNVRLGMAVPNYNKQG